MNGPFAPAVLHVAARGCGGAAEAEGWNWRLARATERMNRAAHDSILAAVRQEDARTTAHRSRQRRKDDRRLAAHAAPLVRLRAIARARLAFHQQAAGHRPPDHATWHFLEGCADAWRSLARPQVPAMRADGLPARFALAARPSGKPDPFVRFTLALRDWLLLCPPAEWTHPGWVEDHAEACAAWAARLRQLGTSSIASRSRRWPTPHF